MPQLNVPNMSRLILENYDAHVHHFVRFLSDKLRCTLTYDGPDDVHQHVLCRTTYACSVKFKRVLRDVFPVMIGSRLDWAIRHHHLREFDKDLPPKSSSSSLETPSFTDLDIAQGFFIVNGFARHVPFFYTNDPTNTHVIQKKLVRVYTYDEHDRGKQLSYYTADYGEYHRGDLVVAHNDGSVTREGIESSFFDHCPYRVRPEAYMTHLHRADSFDIDHLANKTVVSPGHLFVKLFVKYLYGPLSKYLEGPPGESEKWAVVKSKTALVVKSIQTGKLLHVLSRKTLYFKEGKSAGKMTTAPHESHREISANGDVFVEKSMGCYREVNMQTYPLNPYLLHLVVRQISNKVKKDSVPALHPSSIGFLCILGCFETKNVGRTTMMVRDVTVSTCDLLDPVFHPRPASEFWNVLNLAPSSTAASPYHVVVNEACIPVTKACFESLDLLRLKRHFRHVECLRVSPMFIAVRYKVGLLFKRLPETDIWVTPRDMPYWSRHFFQQESLVERFGYPFITSHLVDLNPYFMHNAFPKNILAFNALKNAVLATDKRYALYFMDTVSAYVKEVTSQHQVVLPPADDSFSEHFVLRLPTVVVAYASFQGCTQEDCIVRHKDVKAFDSIRFYTIRIQFEGDGPLTFYPVRGDCSSSSSFCSLNDSLLGTLVNHGESELVIDMSPIHVKVRRSSPKQVHFSFSKTPFRVLDYHLGKGMLSVCVEQDHPSSTGDKLCSLHGQKGVVREMESTLLLDESVRADLVVNVFGMYRMTVGQMKEGIREGFGRDALTVRNSEGNVVEGARVFYARQKYFSIAYWSIEHLYAPEMCVQDKILGQSVKGRSRGGGMRLGNMELMNGMRGNGIASCFDTKFFEHGDRMLQVKGGEVVGGLGVSIPKAVALVQEDARFFKCNLEYEVSPSVVEVTKRKWTADTGSEEMVLGETLEVLEKT